MTNGLSIKQYEALAARTMPDDSPDDALIHAALGLSTEVGELIDPIKRFLYFGKELDLVNIREEIGDILWYLALACKSLDISLDDVAEENIIKLRKRYPVKFTPELALVRADKC